ncbi:MAG TPA: M1 family aminopeptidase [Longimicrobiales bacterium]|nr:M1 family aminopeptidase [Longimicrobiales bacterium]
MPAPTAPRLAAAALVLLAAGPLPAASQDGPSDITPREFLTRLKEHRPATARTAPAAGFAVQRDAASMSFEDGTVTLLEMDGRVLGAVIDGRGSFTIRPPEPVERWQMERVFETPEPTLELEGAVLLFTDGTLAEMESGLAFASGALPRDVPDLLEDGIKFLLHEGSVDSDVIRSLLNGEDDGFFHAHLEVDGKDPHFFRVSALETEEISFGREADGRGDFYEPLASFHQASDYPYPDPTENVVPGAEVLHYELESTIESGLDFHGRAKLYLNTGVDEGDWVPFGLSSELEIRSLAWGDGSAVVWERGKDGGQVWIRMPFGPGLHELHAEYEGDVVEYRDRFFWFADPTGWYPRFGRTDATFDMTFHVSDDYAFVASGSRTELEEGDDVIRSRWVLEAPVSQASFNLGKFKEHLYENEDLPPIRIQLDEDLHRDLRASMVILQDKDPEEAVAADLANSLRFFQDVYGPLDLTEFNVSEIPYLHGQAFPGLIHLSVLTFIRTSEAGYDEMFRAHEAAHQWWGHSVQPRSYRDRWLSEGLAEFSGLWYMQVARFDPTRYFEALDDAREDILDRRGRAGPISLGSRVAIAGRDEDYGTVVYQKGAWVIHMLRNLFIDLETMDESRFRALLRDVATRYKGRRITTVEFQAVVEEHLGGVDMQWFFDQWVHGSDVPTYRWATRGEEVEGGYKLTLRVRQEDVPDDFRMVVPVTLDFGAEGSATVRVMVTGPVTEVDLPLLPREPDDIRFNDYASVLAEVDDEGW